MNTTLEIKLDNYFERKSNLSRAELICAISKDHPNWAESTINVYLSRLKKTGKISNPSRGTYTLTTKKTFIPHVTTNLKKIYSRIHKEYPYVNCCVWETRWLNELMRHQPFKQYLIVEVEKDAIAPVFNYLSDNFKNVFLDPGTEIFDYYIANTGDATIVKPLVSEAPLEKEKKTVIPTLEKLLVDMFIDTDIFAAQQGELEEIYANAFKKYSLNVARMKRYALRRNREHEVNKMISIISAK